MLRTGDHPAGGTQRALQRQRGGRSAERSSGRAHSGQQHAEPAVGPGGAAGEGGGGRVVRHGCGLTATHRAAHRVWQRPALRQASHHLPHVPPCSPSPFMPASPSSTRWGATQPPPRPVCPWSSTLESGWPCSTRWACSPPLALAGAGPACLSAVQSAECAAAGCWADCLSSPAATFTPLQRRVPY